MLLQNTKNVQYLPEECKDTIYIQSVMVQGTMGRTKSRIGRFPKNYEKNKVVKRVGRPRKRQICTSAPTASPVETVSLSDIADSPLDLPSTQWVVQNHSPTNIIICKMSSLLSSGRQSVTVTHCLTINNDLSWTLSVHGMNVDSRVCPLLRKISTKVNKDSLQQLLYLLENSTVCPGHPDEQFIEMAKAKKGKLQSKDGTTVARLDDYSDVTLNDKVFQATVRICTCEVLVSNGKCAKCVSYRNTLRKMRHRWSKQKSLTPTRRQSSRSKVNIRFLNTPERHSRYRDMKRRIDKQSKEVQRLRVAAAVQANGVELEPGLHSDLKGIMDEMTEKIHDENPDGFRRIFWDQQLAALETSNHKQLRWHPAVIKWCLHLKLLSSGGYHALRTSGLITLPSERTLRDYTHFVKAGVGFSHDVDRQLMKDANIKQEKDRFVALVWDEMKVKEGLVFDKHSCNLVGFTNIGQINDDLNQVERECDEENPPSNVATHMLLFMIRGLFTSLEFPYAHFATTGATADMLYPIVWESVRRIESCGLNVIAFTCDGASPNRKFFQMHKVDKSKEPVYKTKNLYANDRDIFFFSDVPHLMKTIRNCWSNSFTHNNARAL